MAHPTLRTQPLLHRHSHSYNKERERLRRNHCNFITEIGNNWISFYPVLSCPHSSPTALGPLRPLTEPLFYFSASYDDGPGLLLHLSSPCPLSILVFYDDSFVSLHPGLLSVAYLPLSLVSAYAIPYPLLHPSLFHGSVLLLLSLLLWRCWTFQIIFKCSSS
jgi:hypothetical protein